MSKALFVTGKLAQEALQNILKKIELPFSYDVAVLPISVAALMNVTWVASKLTDLRGADTVILPGLCQGDEEVLSKALGVRVIKGPKDLKDLPGFFGLAAHQTRVSPNVQILAEIVDAHKLSLNEITERAAYYKAQGASLIDLGGPVKGSIPNVGEIVATLKGLGYKVSLDTFDEATALEADKSGIDLYLSVNGSNMEMARKMSCPVVVIPDFEDKTVSSLVKNVEILQEMGKSYIVDPVLDPLPFGLAGSIHRFVEYKARYPEDEMLMGTGNLTELTEADSTGINALLLGICVELNVNYVLTTEVVSWARGAVREAHLAGMLNESAKQSGVLPKGFGFGLVTIKDLPFESYSEEEIVNIHKNVTDKNFRIFVIGDYIYVFNNSIFLKGKEAGELFAKLDVSDPGHAFYLGRELERASLAARLGKKYVQERPLNWGYLSGDDI
mgnify:CR=1 FL=1